MKECAHDLLKVLSGIGSYKLLREYDYRHERDISRFMENIFLYLSDPNILQNKRNELIYEMKQAMDNEISEQILYSPALVGALEGVKTAIKAGGLYGLKNLINVMNTRSNDKAQQVRQLSEKLDNFINSCLSYNS